MNEATLEQRIVLEIGKCFPFLKKEDIIKKYNKNENINIIITPNKEE